MQTPQPDPMTQPSGDGAHLERTFTVFTVLWTTAVLFHLANQAPWVDKPWTVVPFKVALELCMVAAALSVYAKPGHVWRFLLVVGLQAVHVTAEVPRVANHWLMQLFCDVAMLSAAATVVLRGGQLTAAAWMRALGPGVRWVYLVGYSAAALAKYNWDFVDPEVSCASTNWTAMMAYFGLPFLDGWLIAQATMWGTIVIETAIPLMLLFRRTALPGLLLGMLFHYGISFTPVLRVPDFASFLIAAWFLFTPHSFASALLQKGRELRTTLAGLFPIFSPRRLLVLALGYAAMGFVLALPGWVDPMSWFNQLRINAYAIYGLVAIAWFVLTWRDATVWSLAVSATARHPSLRIVDPVAWGVVGLMCLVASAPYLGHRTLANLSMFSNLTTENGRANHMFVPTVYLWDYQNDLVEVQSTSNARLQLLTADDHLLPWWEFVYTLAHDPEAEVTYRRNGGPVQEVARAGEVAELSAMPSAFERWTLYFRPVTTASKNGCKW